MPKLPTLSPSRRRAEADRQALRKAAGAIAQTLSAAGMAPQGSPGSSWYNAGNAQLLSAAARDVLQAQFKAPGEQVEQALAEQGLSWAPPFGPGRPLSPFAGYRAPARTRDYTVGENVQITPRFGRISFQTLKGIYGAYDVAQICVQHLVNDIRSLDISWVPADGVKSDVSADIDKAQAFFSKPDRRRPFRAWLSMWLQDILRWDAGCLYVRRNNLGEPIALEVVDGTTIIPLTDYYGRLPRDENDDRLSPDGDLDVVGEIVPAFVQVIKGMPWDWLAAEDLIYQPLNPVSESQYGLAPLEKVLLTANTDIRFQWHFLNYFTEGSLPAGFMEAPPDMSDPAQIQQWQEIWDDIMLGDQAKLRQIRWVPSGSKFTPAKNEDFQEAFPLYLMRRTCAAYGVTPADLGFTEDVNKASGDTQIDVQFRVGTLPPSRHVEDIISLFCQEELGLRVRLQIDDGRETEDRVATAQAHSIYIQSGVESPDEVRDELGLQTDKTQAVGRFVQTRQGIVPLEELLGQSKHPIDPETFAPEGKVEYVPPPEPVASEPGHPVAGAGEQTPGDVPDAGERPSLPGGADAAKSFDVLAVWKTLEGEPRFNVRHHVSGLVEYGLTELPAVKEATAGLTAATGVHGVDLPGRRDEDDDDEPDELLAKVALRRWRDNSRNRLRKGRAPRRFVDPSLPDELHERVWAVLKDARTRRQVDDAFERGEAGWSGKARARKAGSSTAEDFHRHSDAIVEHYAPLIAEQLRLLVPKGKLEQVAQDHRPQAAKAIAEPPERITDGDDGQPLREILLDALTTIAGGTRSQKLLDLIVSLWGDAALQGAHNAAHALGVELPDWITELKLPDGYWDDWQPGWGAAAAKVAGAGLKDLLDRAQVTIRDMADTTLERLAGHLADGLAAGDPVGKVAQAALDLVGDSDRAETIANTELARAMTATAMDSYVRDDVEQVEWLAEADACALCLDNKAASPIATGEDWPNGTVPVHPRCRCAVVPHID